MINYIYLKFIALLRKIKQKSIFTFDFIFSRKLHIITSDIHGETILILKEKTIERTFFSKIFNLAEESWVDFIYPKIEVKKFTDALVYSGSDFIITKDGAIWEKFFKPQWSKIIPLDNALLMIKDQNIFIKKAKQIKKIDYGFSLCGVHSTVWAHFLIQYLPKLYLIKEIQEVINHDITVIVPPYKDPQIREIVFPYLSQFKNLNIIELKCNDAINCKVLYHIENTSHLPDNANYINPSDLIIPNFTFNILNNNLIKHFIDNSEDSTKLHSRKLYIGRSGIRNLVNHEEVEQYFISQGFEIIHPHSNTLIDKIKVFSEAAIIVGPASSGFTNLVFCKTGTKALAFVNFQRTFDGYGATLAKNYGIDLILVTGNDQNDSIHSSYYIPLDTVKSAYLELLS